MSPETGRRVQLFKRASGQWVVIDPCGINISPGLTTMPGYTFSEAAKICSQRGYVIVALRPSGVII